MDFLVHRDRHFSGNDVVLGICVMVGIETIEILRALIEQLGVNGAEGSVRTRVAEIKRKLPGLNLNWHGVGCRRGEINVSPSLYAEDSEGHNLRAHQKEGGNYQTLGAAGKGLNFRVRTRVGE